MGRLVSIFGGISVASRLQFQPDFSLLCRAKGLIFFRPSALWRTHKSAGRGFASWLAGHPTHTPDPIIYFSADPRKTQSKGLHLLRTTAAPWQQMASLPQKLGKYGGFEQGRRIRHPLYEGI